MTQPNTISEWSFRNPVEICFGSACISEYAARTTFKDALLVTTAGMVRRGTVDAFVAQWPNTSFEVCDSVTPNPAMLHMEQQADRYRDQAFDCIVALGGGSAMDTAKVLSVLLRSDDGFSLKSHFYDKLPIGDPGSFVPVVTVPTTSGTGSEVTPFSTVWDTENNKKFSLNDPGMFAKTALLAPELTMPLPWEITVSTGLDALCQGLESIWNNNSTPASAAFAKQAVHKALRVLQQGRAILDDLQLRSELMEASLFAGIAISQTRTALSHSMSYPITSHFGVPHGLACGFTVPAVLRFNAQADDGRLAELAASLGMDSVEELASQLEVLLQELGVPQLLSEDIQSPEQVIGITSEMITPDRAGNNLRQPSFDDLEQIMRSAFASIA